MIHRLQGQRRRLAQSLGNGNVDDTAQRIERQGIGCFAKWLLKLLGQGIKAKKV